ncbi:hypothetical protein RY831_28110 [Noviherbaspirillum sp. CPCC 100848]|uniref:Uncharacterized protein n=1 Tax=Noviherbaspirillum album TaxID=3080276 RepID=A0ABU6JIZ9_9BURK|nr:hypothetical protein [Noviherbaspirillum sp. CPCC 100848]MEC4723029.1 hypothetical protein [Noviherbaspirillum sp. CPCC 100848]
MSNQGMWRILERLAVRGDGFGPFLRRMVQSPLFYQTESAAIKIGASCFANQERRAGSITESGLKIDNISTESCRLPIACRIDRKAKISEGMENRKK